jgi:hypothetical protein
VPEVPDEEGRVPAPKQPAAFVAGN